MTAGRVRRIVPLVPATTLAAFCVVVSVACGTAATNFPVTTYQQPRTPADLLGRGEAHLTTPLALVANQSAQVIFKMNLSTATNQYSGVEYVTGEANPRHVVVRDRPGPIPPELTVSYTDVPILEETL